MLARAAISSGVTVHKISKTITFYCNDPPTSSRPAAVVAEQPRPLLLLLPWLGSRPQAVAKYCDIYFRTGFDVLMVESEVSQFLWPRWSLDYGARVLDVLESERFSHRPVLVHAFSIGGYTFGQLMVHIARDRQRYQGLSQRICGHIYDSLVMGSLERMATGLGKNVFPRFESLVKRLSMLYFRTFKQQTVEYFNTAISVFWNSPVTAPALFFFCENDTLCDPESMEEMIAYWQSRGITVEKRRWKESIHAAHLRAHPQEYLSILDSFLQSLNMVPLKAKM
ncbi:transmembrane protein 53-B [Alosa sapidissima]|uniref:transmembrane protein 53-B n=1 Tax=Alosa sapidissima TaxID=34773 RepID=UPI001C092AB2|nr:transmembrane protein 53-B [Alosa sapidissima]XP_041965308.1 transmembrane protein 53-B [Alosa sapidissima]